MTPRCRRGFTLIELLVAVAVIAILIALLMPAVQQSRAAARRTECKNHLHQLGVALHNYHDVHRILPPGSLVVGPVFPQLTGWGWGSMILPYVDQGPLHQQIDFNIGTIVGSNLKVVRGPVPVWTCPSDPAPAQVSVPLWEGGEVEIAHGNYCGVEPTLKSMSHTRFAEIRDGLSQTLLVGERRFYPDINDEPFTSSWIGMVQHEVEYQFNSIPHSLIRDDQPINESASAFSSRHYDGAHFTLSDGSVRLFNESTDGNVLQSLGTPNGGEVVSF